MWWKFVQCLCLCLCSSWFVLLAILRLCKEVQWVVGTTVDAYPICLLCAVAPPSGLDQPFPMCPVVIIIKSSMIGML